MRKFLRYTGLVALVLFVLAHVAAAATPATSVLGPMMGFAGITAGAVQYTDTTDFAKGYRRSTTAMYRTYTRRVDEFQWFDDIPDEEILPSARENLIPLDVAIGYGAHQVTEGGNEGQTDSPALEEGAFVFNHTNARIAVTLTQQAFNEAAQANSIVREIKYKSLKAIEGAMRKWAYQTYFTSTGVLAKVSDNPSSGNTATITLKDAGGISGLGNAAYLANIFPVGEGVGFIRSGVLVGLGKVTDNDATAGTIDVKFNGSDTVDLAADDEIVFANGINGATLAETDYLKFNHGILDALLTDTIHGVSSSTVKTWAPAYFSASGGGFGFVMARQLKQALEDKGDTVLKRLILSRGVLNDKDARERGALIWTNPGSMSLDGSAGMKGVSEDSTRFVPPGCAFAIGADAMGKKVLTKKPGQNATLGYSDLRKAEDVSALKGGFNIWSTMIFRSRSRLAGITGLDEQGV